MVGNQDQSLLEDHENTEENLREDQEKQVKRQLWWGSVSFVSSLPENVTQKHAQDCIKEMAEKKAKAQDSIKWMWIMDPQFGTMKYLQVKVDTGATKNFITEGMALDYNLRKTALDEPQPFDLAVGGIFCSYTVEVSLMGQDNKPSKAEFFVLSGDARIGMPLVGEEWAAHSLCKLFDSKQAGDIAYVGQKTAKADEERATQALRAQATAQHSQLLKAKEARERQGNSQKSKNAAAGSSSTSKQAKTAKQR